MFLAVHKYVDGDGKAVTVGVARGGGKSLAGFFPSPSLVPRSGASGLVSTLKSDLETRQQEPAVGDETETCLSRANRPLRTDIASWFPFTAKS